MRGNVRASFVYPSSIFQWLLILFLWIPCHTVLADGVIVNIRGYELTPETATITVGQSVTWVNNDIANRYRFDSVDNSITSNTLIPGAAFSQTFFNPGTFEYYCTNFPYMKGTVVVKNLSQFISDDVKQQIKESQLAPPQ